MDISVFGNPPDDALVVVLANGFRRYEDDAAIVRLHSACVTGDILGSQRCDCGYQLHASLDAIARAPWGLLVYFLKHEGRGIGLVRKIQAYALQDEGFDTVQANTLLHEPIDAREFQPGIAALLACGVRRVWLLTNNPDKARVLSNSEIRVEGIQRIAPPQTQFNSRYLMTKQHVLGHSLDIVAKSHH
jgi:GTP cyclohydrolase II